MPPVNRLRSKLDSLVVPVGGEAEQKCPPARMPQRRHKTAFTPGIWGVRGLRYTKNFTN